MLWLRCDRHSHSPPLNIPYRPYHPSQPWAEADEYGGWFFAGLLLVTCLSLAKHLSDHVWNPSFTLITSMAMHTSLRATVLYSCLYKKCLLIVCSLNSDSGYSNVLAMVTSKSPLIDMRIGSIYRGLSTRVTSLKIGSWRFTCFCHSNHKQ